MASDWIKMRTDLYRDPKVCVMAELLADPGGELARYVNQFSQRHMSVTRNVMRNVTVGALVSVWGVMRTRGKPENDDLVCKGVTVSVLDDIADLPGFGFAMQEVGWVVQIEDGIVFPRFFEDHNVDPEGSKKSKAAARQARYRDRNKEKITLESDVTSDVTRDVTVTHREEKRREEINNPQTPKGGCKRFEEFWAAWPKSERKQDKVKCAAKWRQHSLDDFADRILEDVATKQLTEKWASGFIEAPLVYLNGRRWEDGVTPVAQQIGQQGTFV